jgi:acetolactate synthase-1/2/3 large subunit
MKLSDYVIDFLSAQGIKNVFGLTGGAVVHLFDSASKHKQIQPIFCHHEQAAALAGVSYARATNHLGAVILTTGPGGTNAITGLLAAWLDSIPCIFISGQSRKEHTTHGKPIRQLGAQEFDIVSFVKNITKYAVMIDDPLSIRYHLEKALFIAQSGRPGPVWLDIPVNLQWLDIDPSSLESFAQIKDKDSKDTYLPELCKRTIDLLVKSERPLMLAGYGLRLAKAEDRFRKLIELLQIPFVATWTASDMVDNGYPLYVGRLGFAGQRGANLAVQNSDLLICLGSHLSVPLTGTMFSAFAREAKIVMVDIDKTELDYETVKVDLPVHSDVSQFVEEMHRQISSMRHKTSFEWWCAKCNNYKSHNEIPREWIEQEEFINPYVLIDTISDKLKTSDIIISDGGGTVVYTTFQSFKVKLGQRLLVSSGLCSMGTGLPESIGASFINRDQRVICFIGDGSMQLNIQELQTIAHHSLNIKVFVFNNNGYLSIRHTQDGFLESSYTGSASMCGISLPNYIDIARAYGVKGVRLNNHKELYAKLDELLDMPGPIVVEIMIAENQQVIPAQGFVKKLDGTFSPRPLEDMYPYLSRSEFLENMIIKPLPYFE